MNYFRLSVTFTLASISTILLIGCPPTPIKLKSMTLLSDEVNASYQYGYSESWECSVPILGQGLFVNGLGPEPVMPGETTVGWEDIYNEGDEPFPCEEQQQTTYRGQVHFHLSQFDNDGL